MSEEIKDLLETLVLMERNNLDHLIRTGQAIKWRKGIEQLQQENKELKRQDFKLKEMLKDKGKDTKFSQRLFEDTIQPNVLLRLKWLKEYGDNLNSDEIKEILNYIDFLQNRVTPDNIVFLQNKRLMGINTEHVIELNHYIEFEKWLEKELFNKTQIHFQYSLALRRCYDKLQELKEGKK